MQRGSDAQGRWTPVPVVLHGRGFCDGGAGTPCWRGHAARQSRSSCYDAANVPMKQSLPMRNLLMVAVALMAQLVVADEIAQPAGFIPVLQEVDVVVVGGGSGGVAAAVEAARAGAKVFLAAPRPYLGEDMCATYRLWLEPGETPSTDLAREVFTPGSPPPAPIGRGLPFKYSASQPSAPKASRYQAGVAAERWPMGERIPPKCSVRQRRRARARFGCGAGNSEGARDGVSAPGGV